MEDRELIEKILLGQVKYFEELIDRYELSIVRYIYGLMGDRDMAEDLTQETFITAYNKLGSYKKEYKFSTWLFTIARNKSIDYLRKNSKSKVIDIELANNMRSNEISPEASAEYKETKVSVERFLDGLGPVDKQILYIKYHQPKITFKEISEILAMNESTVKKRYYRLYEKYENFQEKRMSERSDNYGMQGL